MHTGTSDESSKRRKSMDGPGNAEKQSSSTSGMKVSNEKYSYLPANAQKKICKSLFLKNYCFFFPFKNIFCFFFLAVRRKRRLSDSSKEGAGEENRPPNLPPQPMDVDSANENADEEVLEGKKRRFCFKPQTLEEAITSQRGLLHLKASDAKKKASGKAKAKAKAQARHTKGTGGQAAKKYNAIDIRHFSNANQGIKCSCSKECYKKIDPEVTRHYREILYASGGGRGGRYERRKFIYSLLTDEAKRERMWRAFNRKMTSDDGGEMKMTYRLQNLHNGQFFRVCEGAFCGVLGISKGTLVKLVRLAKAGKPLVRDKHLERLINKKMKSAEYTGICTYLETLAEDLANHSPDCRVTELPSGFKCHFYDMFCAEWKKGLLTGLYHRSAGRSVGKNANKPPSKSLFYRVWRLEFPNLKVPKRNNRFSKCDWCTGVKTHLESARQKGDQEEVNYWKKCLYDHYAWVSLQRRKYHKHRRKAAENPAK